MKSPSEMSQKIPSKEAEVKFSVEKVHEDLSPADERAIRALPINALDETQVHPAVQDLGEGMQHIAESHGREGSHSKMIVLREGEKIVGCVAFEKTEDGVHITQLRLASGKGADAIEALFKSVGEYMVEKKKPKITLGASAPIAALDNYLNNNDFDRENSDGATHFTRVMRGM